MEATAIANSNIALVKYWGRQENKVPFNSSFAVTMDSQLSTKTTVEFSEENNEDIFIFDGKMEKGVKLQKVIEQLNNVRKVAKTDLKARVISQNTFPHSAGLAASASGFCALTAAACKALNLDLTLKELSRLISIGPSGSATRSVFGGFVEWNKEENCAIHYYDENYWPELRNVVAIVDTSEKRIGSAEGMQLTVKTSRLFGSRLATAKQHLAEVKEALKNKDKEKLFTVIMKESNNMHAVMTDTWPPLFYLNDLSKEIIYKVHELNKPEVIAGYTFDAGSNAHIFTTLKSVDKLKSVLGSIVGVKEIIVCKPGGGLRYSTEHLKWKN